MLGQQAIKDKVASNPNLIMAKAHTIALKSKGMNLREITEQFKMKGFKTSMGNKYYPMSKVRLLK
jgi:hypothetical protein